MFRAEISDSVTQRADKLLEALIENINLVYPHCLRKRSEALSKKDKRSVELYEKLLVEVAGHIPNLLNVVETYLQSELDEDVALGLELLGERLVGEVIDDNRKKIRHILLGKLGIYKASLETEIVRALLRDSDRVSVFLQIDQTWPSFSIDQQLAAISVLSQLRLDIADKFLENLKQSGKTLTLRATANEALATRTGPSSSGGYWERWEKMMMKPEAALQELQSAWQTMWNEVQRDIGPEGVAFVESARNLRNPIQSARVPQSGPKPQVNDLRPAGQASVENDHQPPKVAHDLNVSQVHVPQGEPTRLSTMSTVPNFTDTGAKSPIQSAAEIAVTGVASRSQLTGVRGISPTDAVGTHDQEVTADVAGTMSFFDHLEELRSRLLRSSIVGWLGFFLAIALFQGGIAADWLGLPNHSTSVVDLSILTLSLGLAPVLGMPYFMYQFVMFVAPGLTRKERNWMFLILPILLNSIALFFAGLFVLSLQIAHLTPLGLDGRAYLVEKLTLIVLPVLLIFLVVLVSARLIVNTIRSNVSKYNVVIGLFVWLTGSTSNWFVGKRNAEAMRRRVITRLGLHSDVGKMESLTGTPIEDLFSFIPKQLFGDVSKWFIWLLIPFAYLVLPIMAMITLFFSMVRPRQIARWSWLIGQLIRQFGQAIREMDRTFSDEINQSQLWNTHIKDLWKLNGLVLFFRKFVFVPIWIGLLVATLVTWLPDTGLANTSFVYSGLAMWLLPFLFIAFEIIVFWGYVAPGLTKKEIQWARLGLLGGLVILAVWALFYSFIARVTDSLSLSLYTQLNVVNANWWIITGLGITGIVAYFSNDVYRSMITLAILVLTISAALFPAWLTASVVLFGLFRLNPLLQTYLKKKFTWLAT